MSAGISEQAERGDGKVDLPLYTPRAARITTYLDRRAMEKFGTFYQKLSEEEPELARKFVPGKDAIVYEGNDLLNDSLDLSTAIWERDNGIFDKHDNVAWLSKYVDGFSEAYTDVMAKDCDRSMKQWITEDAKERMSWAKDAAAAQPGNPLMQMMTALVAYSGGLKERKADGIKVETEKVEESMWSSIGKVAVAAGAAGLMVFGGAAGMAGGHDTPEHRDVADHGRNAEPVGTNPELYDYNKTLDQLHPMERLTNTPWNETTPALNGDMLMYGSDQGLTNDTLKIMLRSLKTNSTVEKPVFMNETDGLSLGPNIYMYGRMNPPFPMEKCEQMLTRDILTDETLDTWNETLGVRYNFSPTVYKNTTGCIMDWQDTLWTRILVFYDPITNQNVIPCNWGLDISNKSKDLTISGNHVVWSEYPGPVVKYLNMSLDPLKYDQSDYLANKTNIIPDIRGSHLSLNGDTLALIENTIPPRIMLCDINGTKLGETGFRNFTYTRPALDDKQLIWSEYNNWSGGQSDLYRMKLDKWMPQLINKTPFDTIHDWPDSNRAYYIKNFASDPDSDALKIISIDNPLFKIMPPEPESGFSVYTNRSLSGRQYFNITIADNDNNLATKEYYIDFIRDNTAPMINMPENMTIRLGKQLHFMPNISDPENDPFEVYASDILANVTDRKTGEVNYTPMTSDIGIHNITFRAKDIYDAESTVNVILEVLKNNPPIINGIPRNITAHANKPLQLMPNITDPDKDAFEVFTNGILANATDRKTGYVNYTPTQADIGRHNITFRARDQYGAESIANMMLDVLKESEINVTLPNETNVTSTNGTTNQTNHPPVFDEISQLKLRIKSYESIVPPDTRIGNITAKDDDNDTLTYFMKSTRPSYWHGSSPVDMFDLSDTDNASAWSHWRNWDDPSYFSIDNKTGEIITFENVEPYYSPRIFSYYYVGVTDGHFAVFKPVEINISKNHRPTIVSMTSPNSGMYDGKPVYRAKTGENLLPIQVNATDEDGDVLDYLIGFWEENASVSMRNIDSIHNGTISLYRKVFSPNKMIELNAKISDGMEDVYSEPFYVTFENITKNSEPASQSASNWLGSNWWQMTLATGWAATLGASYATRRKRNEYMESHQYLRSVWNAFENDIGTRNRAMATAVLGTLSTIGTAATFPAETMNALASAKDIFLSNSELCKSGLLVGSIPLLGIGGYKGAKDVLKWRDRKNEERARAVKTLPSIPYDISSDPEISKIHAELNNKGISRVKVLDNYQCRIDNDKKDIEALLGKAHVSDEISASASDQKMLKKFKKISREALMQAFEHENSMTPEQKAWANSLKEIYEKHG
ncbi:MAG: hypothetical protein V1887_02900 [Candidatus Aenigmatarchaeota archaeon]